MRLCSVCKLEKSETEFYWKNKKKGIKQYACNKCYRKKHKQYYLNNKDYYKEKAKRQKIRNKQKIIELKSKPCSDCHQEYPYYVMDFDHRPGEEKLFGIGGATGWRSKGRIFEEIDKCDLVCSNCHRVRTFNRIMAHQTTHHNFAKIDK